MYAWIWRHLPGPWPLRLVIMLAGVALIVWVLFLYVFPWAEEILNISEVTVD